MTKTFTLREFIEAIRQNGLPQDTGSLFQYLRNSDDIPVVVNYTSSFDYEEGVIVGACAFGQALINLGIDRPYLGDNFLGILFEQVWKLNDNDKYTYKQIADWLEKNYADELDAHTFEANEFDYSPYLGATNAVTT